MRAFRLTALGLCSLLTASCQPTPPAGPEDAPAAPRPVAAKGTVAPTATPTAIPTAAPTTPPSETAQAGPVKYLRATVLSAGDGGILRDPPFDDGQGHQVVNFGETVVFDLTPKNAANVPCDTVGEPSWTVRDNKDAGNRDYLTVLNSNNPFVLRARANARTGKALVHLWAEVDGVASNHLFVIVK